VVLVDQRHIQKHGLTDVQDTIRQYTRARILTRGELERGHKDRYKKQGPDAREKNEARAIALGYRAVVVMGDEPGREPRRERELVTVLL
jgi:hypothetical protein